MTTQSAKASRQSAIIGTNEVIQYIKPIGVHTFWHVLKHDPRFPAPVLGGNGGKALYAIEQVDAYLREAGRTGFYGPDGERVVDLSGGAAK